jgi:hypothetical protein
MMRFLANENIPQAAVVVLAAAGAMLFGLVVCPRKRRQGRLGKSRK